MMTREEFLASERLVSARLGTSLYDRLLGKYPINAWSDDELNACAVELYRARERLTGPDRDANGAAVSHVLIEIDARKRTSDG